MSCIGAIAQTFCGALRTAVVVFAHRMCTIWCKSLSQPLKCSSRSPQARQIAGRVVCGSKVDIIAEISARDSAAMEKSFLQLVFEVLCGATATLVQLLDCRPHRTRCTLLRANHSHRSEIAECFVLLPVVYRDNTFKMTPLKF